MRLCPVFADPVTNAYELYKYSYAIVILQSCNVVAQWCSWLELFSLLLYLCVLDLSFMINNY